MNESQTRPAPFRKVLLALSPMIAFCVVSFTLTGLGYSWYSWGRHVGPLVLVGAALLTWWLTQRLRIAAPRSPMPSHVDALRIASLPLVPVLFLVVVAFDSIPIFVLLTAAVLALTCTYTIWSLLRPSTKR